MNKVVARYPLSIRCGAVLVCVLLAISMFRSRTTTGAIVVGVGALCLCVALWAYRAEVKATEVRVRYLPFYTKRTPMGDVTHLLEGKTLFLVTATSKIPLWGCSLKDRGLLFEIIPRHLEVMPMHLNKRTDSTAVVRRHVRWTILCGIGFAVTAAAVTPFLAGFPLHDYWNSAGKYLLLLCMGFFIVFIFEAGFTYVLWSSKRAFDKIEREQQLHRHG